MEVNVNDARGLDRWIALASSSLPVPLSPVMRTGTSLAACSSASFSRRSILSDRVTMGAKASLCLIWGRLPVLPTEMTSRRRRLSVARRIFETSSSRETGLVR